MGMIRRQRIRDTLLFFACLMVAFAILLVPGAGLIGLGWWSDQVEARHVAACAAEGPGMEFVGYHKSYNRKILLCHHPGTREILIVVNP